MPEGLQLAPVQRQSIRDGFTAVVILETHQASWDLTAAMHLAADGEPHHQGDRKCQGM